jgi:AhpD family alkylhydroperoxidase
MPTERKEPTFVFTEREAADKSEIARRFLETRTRLNANVDKADNFLVKRFYNIDHNTYLEGAIPSKYKELMGLVVSAGLRCDDCIQYHIIQSYRLGATREEQEESLNVAPGGRRQHCDSAFTPSLRVADGVVRVADRPMSVPIAHADISAIRAGR